MRRSNQGQIYHMAFVFGIYHNKNFIYRRGSTSGDKILQQEYY